MTRHPLYEEIRQRLEDGKSDLAISRTLGIARRTAAKYRRQLGIAPHYTNAESTHCRRGHPFDEENAAYNEAGHRYCRTCIREAHRERARANYVPRTPDEIAVERAVSGDPPEHLTPRERASAVGELCARGKSVTEIAEHVRCTDRNVWRIKSRLRDDFDAVS